MRQLKSPKQNVAQKTLLIVQTATTRIKELITDSLFKGKSQKEISKRLNKLISDTCKEISNTRLREETRKALVTSSRKWYYHLNQSLTILKRNLINGLTLQDGTYNFDTLTYFKNNIDKTSVNQIRPYLDKTNKGLAVISDYDKKLDVALSALAAEPPKVIDISGKKPYTMSLRNRAEMTVRYEANMQDLKGLVNEGVEYVWTSSHADASPRCAPHQGKLYSLNPNNKSGRINGIPYTYLPDVLEENGGNSIINGYNCRHRLIEYEKGSKPPDDYSKQEIKKEYRNDQKQRYYENRIRQLKTEERLLRKTGNKTDLEKAKKLRLRWRKLNKKYEIESLKMGRAFYRWRTRIDRNEEYYNA